MNADLKYVIKYNTVMFEQSIHNIYHEFDLQKRFLYINFPKGGRGDSRITRKCIVCG